MESFPKWLLIPLAIWAVAVETAARLPDVLLSVSRYQATQAEYEAKRLQPLIAVAQLEKAQAEAKAAAFQPALVAAQALGAEQEAVAKSITMDLSNSGRLHAMLDILDPNHPNLVSRGVIDPTKDPRYLGIIAEITGK